MHASWRPTRALLFAATTVAGLLFGAVALHRPDLVVLAAPLAAGLAVNLARVPPGRLSARLRSSAAVAAERQRVDLVLRFDAADDADLVASRVRPGKWLTATGSATRVVLPSVSEVRHPAATVRWARTSAGRADVVVTAAQGYLQREGTVHGGSMTIVPFRDRFDAVDVLPHAVGTLGAHRSRRPGTGSEFDTVRPFATGDRLRRIRWPVSLRTGTLHVTSTLSERDTTVLLVLDSSVDVVAGNGLAPGGSLDIAVHAAASIAEHYLRHGDRVGFVDHARAARPIRPAAGRAHLDRIVDALLDVQPDPSAAGTALTRTARRIAPRSTVMLLSPLIGAAEASRAAELAAAGSTVLVIDTLGDAVPAAGDNPWNEVGWRLMLLERRVEIDRLAAAGVPVVPWRGPGSLDSVLRTLSRAAAAPRVHQ